jgi:hypothetical protein
MNGNIFLLLLLFNRETRLQVSSVVQPHHECKGVKGKKIYIIYFLYTGYPTNICLEEDRCSRVLVCKCEFAILFIYLYLIKCFCSDYGYYIILLIAWDF